MIINKNNLDIEVDVLLYKSGKTYGIECKALSPNKLAKISDIAEVLNYSDVVNHSILAISSTLNKKAEKLLNNKEVIIIENNRIEDIGKILKKI